MTNITRRRSRSEIRSNQRFGFSPNVEDQTGRALTKWRGAAEATVIKRELSPAPNDVSLLPWQRAMLLASLRHEEIGNISLHEIVSPPPIPRLPSVPLVPLRARKNRLANMVPTAETILDSVRRLTALSLFWLAHRVLRSAFRLYLGHVITARNAQFVLLWARALEGAAVAVMFGSRRRRHARAHRRGNF